MKKNKHLDSIILPNRYGVKVKLLFDHKEEEKEYYKLDLSDTNYIRLQKAESDEKSEEIHYDFIDWDGGEGYHLGQEFYGYKLIDIFSILRGGFYFVVEPI